MRFRTLFGFALFGALQFLRSGVQSVIVYRSEGQNRVWLPCAVIQIEDSPHSTPSFVALSNMALNEFWLQSFVLFVFLIKNCSFNLTVNIKAKDGEIVQQNFFADPEKDYVTIDFKNNEDRFVSVYIDFRLVRFSFFVRLFQLH